MSTPLPRLEIASPCEAAWADMVGDDRVRHCAHCDQNVYNVAALSTAEVLILIQRERRMPCLRLWQRPDGTVLTADCPVGLRRTGSRRQRVAAALILSALACFTAPAPAQERPLMGKVAAPPVGPKPPKPPRKCPARRPPTPPLQGAVAVRMGEAVAPATPLTPTTPR